MASTRKKRKNKGQEPSKYSLKIPFRYSTLYHDWVLAVKSGNPREIAKAASLHTASCRPISSLDFAWARKIHLSNMNYSFRD